MTPAKPNIAKSNSSMKASTTRTGFSSQRSRPSTPVAGSAGRGPAPQQNASFQSPQTPGRIPDQAFSHALGRLETAGRRQANGRNRRNPVARQPSGESLLPG